MIVRMSSLGAWGPNTGLKPTAILEAWEHIGSPWFLYTDIDARIDSCPAVPDIEWDVAVFDNPNPGHKNRTAAAAIFFRMNPQARTFLLAWRNRCRAAKYIDHPHFTTTLSDKGAIIKNAKEWMRWSQNGLSKTKPEFFL